MTDNLRLEGIQTVVVTPFDRRGEIDFEVRAVVPTSVGRVLFALRKED